MLKKVFNWEKYYIWSKLGVWRVMLLFSTGMFQNSEIFLNASYRDSLIENNILILNPTKRSILAEVVSNI